MPADARAAQEIRDALAARGQRSEGLTPVGVRPPLGEYLGQLWERRHFILMDARHRVATQNRRNRFGNLWLLLRPLLDATMYFVIFGVILASASRGVDNFAAYVIIGILMFRSTMRAVSQGSNTLQAGRAMIRAFTFPRASLVVAAELRDALQMVYTVAMVLVMIMVVPTHEWPEWTWLLLPVVFALQFVLNLGISLVLARVGHLFPDTTQIMGFVARLLMYGSGVIFPIENFVDHPVLNGLIQANPIYHLLLIYREILMDGTAPSLEHWLILGAWAAGLTLFGFLFFWRGEETYGGGQ